MRERRPILSYWCGYSRAKERELQELIQAAGMKKTKRTSFGTAENIIRFVVRSLPFPSLP